MPRRRPVSRRSARRAALLAVVGAVGAFAVVSSAHGSVPVDDVAHVAPAGSGAVLGIDTRPNVVLITTDDQTLADLKWMDKTRADLGDAGATFTSMLSPHPLCCPARAEILTGQYAQNNGVHTNGGPYGGFQALRQPGNTLASWLHGAGYHTGMTGKFLNGYNATDGVQPGWDDWDVSATDGFGYRSFTMYDNGTVEHYPRSSGAYSTDVVAQRTVDLIDRWSPTGQPFFLWSSFYAPHGLCGEGPACDAPPEPAPEHMDDLLDVRSPSLSKPSYAAPLHKPNPMVAGDPVQNRHDMQYLFTRRIQALQSVDDAVDRIVTTLADTGELANTVILFTSDNGYLLGEHHYHGKVLPYEEALRVPLLVRGPNVPAGVTRGQVVTTVDLAPTIAAYAGVTPSRVQDGRNLIPALTSGKRLAGGTNLIQAGPFAAAKNPKPWMYRGVRTSRYTYTEWTSGDHFKELFDRRNDPYELQNVADSKHYRQVRKALHRRVVALSSCSGAQCHQDFPTLPQPTS